MPNPTLNLDEWRNRWDALEKTMAHMLETMPKQGHCERQSTLMGTLTALNAFGGSQMAFFLQGFDPAGTVRLEPSTEYPPEYALRTTLDNLAQDMDIITRAWQQRLPALASPQMIATLNKADTLAYQALEPAIRHKLVPTATVITYFQKTTTVRLIPYAPVIFIGLPISVMTSPQDLLAVPHEVGHYVYHFGKAPSTSKFAGNRFAAALNYRFANKPDWCVAWLEEIFADVYGALTGGPAMTLGFEALVTDDPRKKFTFDDGEHPVAALAPRIYHTVFKVRSGFEQAHAALVNHWEGWLEERGNPETFTSAKGETVQLSEAQLVLEQVIGSLLKEELADVHVSHPWSTELDNGKPVDALRQKFVAYVDALPSTCATNVPDLSHDDTWLCLKAPEMKAVEYKVGKTGLWIDTIKAAAQGKQQFNMPPEAWMALLDGSGWVTEGPPGGFAHSGTPT